MKTKTTAPWRDHTALPGVLAAVLVAALGTSACGDSEDPDSGTTPITNGTSSSTTPGPSGTTPMPVEPTMTETPAVTPSPAPTPVQPTVPTTAPTPVETPEPEPEPDVPPALPTPDMTETDMTPPETPMDGEGGAGGEGGETDVGMDMDGMGGMGMTETPEPEPVGGGDPVPSAGCGQANPQTGSRNGPISVSNHNYYVKLPNGYDPNTPYKVMIVFPPTNNPITWSEDSAGYEQAAPDAIRVYTHMSNEGSGWQPNETSFFQGLYDAITSNFCVDENAIFAGGESSGGEFAGFIGCEYGDIVRGVVPTAPKVTNWQINLGSHECKGNPTAIVIWSERDSVLSQPAGSQFRDFYRDMNMCDQTSSPVEGWTDDMSNCQMFEGCLDGSNTYYCMHNDPEYGNTYHGWPHFAAEMTWQVFSAL